MSQDNKQTNTHTQKLYCNGYICFKKNKKQKTKKPTKKNQQNQKQKKNTKIR